MAIAGIAKGATRARAVAPSRAAADRIFLPGRSRPAELEPDSAALHLCQRVRDEAHRFALAYHRRLRGRGSRASPLDGVAGLGPVVRGRLMERFGGLRGLRAASIEEIEQVKGIGPVLARRIRGVLGD